MDTTRETSDIRDIRPIEMTADQITSEAFHREVNRVSVENLLALFVYDHLPLHLQHVSRRFCDLARLTIEDQGATQETAYCLRRLLEAKDAAVRAAALAASTETATP